MILRRLLSPSGFFLAISAAFLLLFAYLVRANPLQTQSLRHLFYLYPLIIFVVIAILTAFSDRPRKFKNLILSKLSLASAFVFTPVIINRLANYELLKESLAQIIFAFAGLGLGYLLFHLSTSADASYGKGHQIEVGLIVLAVSLAISFSVQGFTYIQLYYDQAQLGYSYQAISSIAIVLFVYLVWTQTSTSASLSSFLIISNALLLCFFSGKIGSLFGSGSFLFCAALAALLTALRSSKRAVTLLLLLITSLLSVIFWNPNLIFDILQGTRSETLLTYQFDFNSLSSISSRAEIRSCMLDTYGLIANFFGSEGVCYQTREHSYLALAFQAGSIAAIAYSGFLFLYTLKIFCSNLVSVEFKCKLIICSPIFILSALVQTWPSFLMYLYLGLLIGIRNSIQNHQRF